MERKGELGKEDGLEVHPKKFVLCLEGKQEPIGVFFRVNQQGQSFTMWKMI